MLRRASSEAALTRSARPFGGDAVGEECKDERAERFNGECLCDDPNTPFKKPRRVGSCSTSGSGAGIWIALDVGRLSISAKFEIVDARLAFELVLSSGEEGIGGLIPLNATYDPPGAT